MMVWELCLKLVIDEVRDMYDFVLIDCLFFLGYLIINVFIVSDLILIFV